MSDPTNEEVMEAVGALRKEVTKNVPNPETVEKINVFLDEQEAKDQARALELKSAETRETELKERMEVLELELARGTNIDEKNYKDSPEYKALNMLCAKGVEFMDAESKALLRTDSNPDGGYLVTGEMDTAIIKQITEISNIRSISRVRTISSKSLEMPKRTGILSATFEGEGESGGDSASSYGSETIVPFRQTVTVPITRDMLMDANFNMESEILADASEAFAQSEGAFHVNGDGVKKPEGFLQNSIIVAAARTSTTSATVDADDVILLTGDLKAGYNPGYTMNRRTLAFLRTLKSTDGVFLWQPGLNGPVANTINGFPYLLANDMPDIASNSLSIAFGDFQRGYTIIDRTGISVIRDELTRKKEAIIEFTINRWTTGQVTLPEAIQLLKTKA